MKILQQTKALVLTFVLMNGLWAAAPLQAQTSSDDQVTSSADKTTTDSDALFTEEQLGQIDQQIKTYILKNPEILIEAGKILQEKQIKAEQDAAITAITKNKSFLFNDKTSPILGNPDGKNVLVEFYDYQCGHCKDMNPAISALLADNNTKLILKELPIFGGNSEFAAKASIAVFQISPENFEKFHKQLLDVNGPLSEEIVTKTAKQLDIDITKMKQAMEKSDIDEELKNNFKLAQSIGIKGTPAFVLSNSDLTKFEFVPGATSKENLEKLMSGLQQ